MRRATCVLLAAATPACAVRPAVDLLAAGANITSADMAGRGPEWLRGQLGKSVRIGDDERRVVPAPPPSRVAFRLAVPRHSRLTFACGVERSRWNAAPVEFLVKIRRGNEQRTLTRLLLDPANRPSHRGFVPGSADLSDYPGAGELWLETRSAETSLDPRTVVWATPVVTSDADAPLAIVYLVDTLRADHASAYGYARDTTPELTRFAARAVTFENAVSHAPWTKPSVASLFTSLPPGGHRTTRMREPFSPPVKSLAERLQARGFATGAFVANSVIYEKDSGFERGFDVFKGVHDREGRPSTRTLAEDVVNEALAWLDANRGRPAFLYVHTMDPHIPYHAPPPFEGLFDPKPTSDSPGHDPREQQDPAARLASYVARYDEEIAYGDREFGRFLRGLAERGRLAGALLAFLADHGEEFLDHGQWLHGRSVFDELVRIPLIVKFPGSRDAGRRVAQQVQVVDIAPTVLAALGLQPEASDRGRPLQERLFARQPDTRPATLELSHRGVVAYGLRTASEKYVRGFSPSRDEWLFDLARDPGETHNLAADKPDHARALWAKIEPDLLPNPFRHVIRVAGVGDFRLEVATGGFIQDVDAQGLGPGESAAAVPGSGRLGLQLRPRPGAPREVSFLVRPAGARVTLSGSRNARPLRGSEVRLGADALPAPDLPVAFPDVDGEANPFAPSGAPVAGIAAWLSLAPGQRVMELDPEARERLRALGYLGP